MKSIQTRFIALILGCVLLSSAVIGGVSIFTAKQVVDKDSAQIMNLLCAEKAQEIDALLSHIEQSVDTLAFYAVGQLGSVESLRTNDAYMDTYMESTLRPVADELRNTRVGSYLFSYTMRGEDRRLGFCSLQNGMSLGITALTAEIDACKIICKVFKHSPSYMDEALKSHAQGYIRKLVTRKAIQKSLNEKKFSSWCMGSIKLKGDGESL